MSASLLITGGLGYLGGRLASYFASQSSFVRLTSRTNGRAFPDWTKSFEVVTVDFGSGHFPKNLCHGIDTVVHLAALNAQQCAEDPIKAIQTNTVGTCRLLNECISAGVKKFIYLSTAHVYGAPLEGFVDEETTPRPGHPYAWSHRAAEDIVNGMNGIETVVLRMTNVVGAPEDPDVNCWMLVANSLCREAVTRGSITLKGSGEEFRDFITITDFCRAIDHFSNIDISDFQPRVFNLGGGCATPVINLAKRIAGRVELLGRPRPLVTRELPRDKPCQFDYRIDNLLKTGFYLRGDLDNEIDETLALCAAAFDII